MKKPTVRFIAILLVALLTLGLFSGVFAMFAGSGGGGLTVGAYAATPSVTAVPAKIITADTSVSKTLTVGKVSTGLTVKFNFIDPDIIDFPEKYTYRSDEFTMPLDSSFGWSYNTTLDINRKTKASTTYYEATLKNASYNGGSSKTLEIDLTYEDFAIRVPIQNKYFKESTEKDGTPESNTAWQSTVVRNAAGQKLASMDKKTGPVKVEVTFYDIGLKDEGNAAIDAAKKHVYISTPVTGFKLHKGSAGTIERISSSTEYPRFRATFEGVESTGAANSLNFRVLYDFEGYDKSIEGKIEAPLFQIKTESEDEDEDEGITLIPKIIVQEYSYGKDTITAGDEFELSIVLANTSKTVAVENVEMRIEEGNGFRIAAASNTAYFPGMGAGESKPYTVALRALPSQNTTGTNNTPTDYSVTIKFSYQYQKNKKEHPTVETPGNKIAIPVEQLDRFSVDEITDYSAYLTVGSEGYLSVPITNKGKSATMNITGSISSAGSAEFTAPPVHFGNLEAGKTGTVSIAFTVNTPGEFTGEAVISYEDENMNLKEIKLPFSVMVNEFIPPTEMPVNPDMNAQENKISPISISLIVFGGLMLASPVAMILMKRIKSRGNEDFDEDF